MRLGITFTENVSLLLRGLVSYRHYNTFIKTKKAGFSQRDAPTIKKHSLDERFFPLTKLLMRSHPVKKRRAVVVMDSFDKNSTEVNDNESQERNRSDFQTSQKIFREKQTKNKNTNQSADDEAFCSGVQLTK